MFRRSRFDETKFRGKSFGDTMFSQGALLLWGRLHSPGDLGGAGPGGLCGGRHGPGFVYGHYPDPVRGGAEQALALAHRARELVGPNVYCAQTSAATAPVEP